MIELNDSIYFNYVTTNTINGKQYVGMHKTKNIDDGYLGSGKLLKYSIKKYGKENFIRDIICFCDDCKSAYINESILIIKYDTLYPKGYNLSVTGGPSFLGHSFSEETLIKLRVPNPKKGQKGPKSDVHKRNIGLSQIGRKLSKESCNKISNSLKDTLNDPTRNGMLGKCHSEKSNEKNREKALNREKIQCEHCIKIVDKSNFGRWHGDNCKNKSK